MDIDNHSPGRKPDAKVIIVTNLTRNVVESHLKIIFGFYGQITKFDLPLFGKCALQDVALLLNTMTDHFQFRQLDKTGARQLSSMPIHPQPEKPSPIWTADSSMVQSSKSSSQTSQFVPTLVLPFEVVDHADLGTDVTDSDLSRVHRQGVLVHALPDPDLAHHSLRQAIDAEVEICTHVSAILFEEEEDLAVEVLLDETAIIIDLRVPVPVPPSGGEWTGPLPSEGVRLATPEEDTVVVGLGVTPFVRVALVLGRSLGRNLDPVPCHIQVPRGIPVAEPGQGPSVEPRGAGAGTTSVIAGRGHLDHNERLKSVYSKLYNSFVCTLPYTSFVAGSLCIYLATVVFLYDQIYCAFIMNN
jgi:hypothetical protein